MTPADDGLAALLEHLKEQRGFDFTGYKPTSLERRIRRRMETVGSTDYTQYLDVLEVDPREFNELFNTILINVTGFFRDPEAWDHLRGDVLPALVATRSSDDPIRVWVAGCASGEEAYTIAIVLAELLGPEAFQARVKIYATDVDEEALATARAAVYDGAQVEGVPPEILERWFEPLDTRWCVTRDLRRTVIFGRNDLVQDAPISRVDVLLCRNTLMYFTAETQARILGRFHFALREDGILCLGKSEMLITHSDVFVPMDTKRRTFRKVPRGRRIRDGGYLPIDSTRLVDATLQRSAMDAGPVAQIVVDADGTLAAANRPATLAFGLAPDDLGRPLQDLEVSYRPLELRARIAEARDGKRSVVVQGIVHRRPGAEDRTYDVQVTPLRDGALDLGTTVTYLDVTATRALHDELQQARVELERAYDELQSTIEELETTNEELQSTNEELETTNEELQSTNEELETMNEELQSTNEELETMNDELRQRSLDLNDANLLLEAILASIGMAVAVVDAEQRVREWNRHAEELWGLRVEEVRGLPLLTLDIGLPVDQLAAGLRAVVTGRRPEVEQELEATNRRGRPVRCHVTLMPLAAVDGEESAPRGAIVLMAIAADG